jgi:two-component system response regulator PilR (NtrC family)
LVVTDLHMFAEDGIELVRHVADSYPDTYSMVVSGFATGEDVDRITRAGAFALMTKPIDAERFATTVESAFEHRKETVALRRHRSG